MPKMSVQALRERMARQKIGLLEYRFVEPDYNPSDRDFAVIDDPAVIAENRAQFERVVAGGGPGSERWRAIAPSETRTMLILQAV